MPYRDAPDGNVGRASMCVLVVEDDFLIRLILVEELEDAGYHVKETGTGDDAVLLLEALDVPLTALVTDIHMPGSLSGLDVAAYVRDRMPGIPVVFTTGRPDAMKGKVLLGPEQTLVRKPYVPSEVVDHVQRLIAQRALHG